MTLILVLDSSPDDGPDGVALGRSRPRRHAQVTARGVVAFGRVTSELPQVTTDVLLSVTSVSAGTEIGAADVSTTHTTIVAVQSLSLRTSVLESKVTTVQNLEDEVLAAIAWLRLSCGSCWRMGERQDVGR